MTNEEKQALIDFAECVLSNYESRSYMAGTKSEALIRIALAALTAQPVKLPNCVDDLHGIGPVMSADEVESAIRAAGYEVRE